MLVLDTHAPYGWANQTPGKLAQSQVNVIETADFLAISAMTCWEKTWLATHDRITLKLPISEWLNRVEESSVAIIPVSRMIAELAVTLPEHRKDPFDRIIIATAIAHQAQLASVDERFPDYWELAELLVKT